MTLPSSSHAHKSTQKLRHHGSPCNDAHNATLWSCSCFCGTNMWLLSLRNPLRSPLLLPSHNAIVMCCVPVLPPWCGWSQESQYLWGRRVSDRHLIPFVGFVAVRSFPRWQCRRPHNPDLHGSRRLPHKFLLEQSIELKFTHTGGEHLSSWVPITRAQYRSVSNLIHWFIVVWWVFG